MAYDCEGDHPFDWSHRDRSDEENDPINYERFYRGIGELARDALRFLSLDADDMVENEDGWAPADTTSLELLFEIDWLGALMAPPETVPLDGRLEANELVRALHDALPFTEGERWWLLTDALNERRSREPEPHDLDPVREAEAEIMTHGRHHPVNGHDLLQRFRSWRRCCGEYEEGDGLASACDALAGLATLFRPDLDLPDDYLATRRDGGE